MIRLPATIVAGLRERAHEHMATHVPGETIGPYDRPLLLRWFVVRRHGWPGLFIHRFLRDDDDRALHDHPWSSVSVMLAGVVEEIYVLRGTDPRDPSRHLRRWLVAGDVVWRPAEFSHRIMVRSVAPADTLFFVGPKVREWGFHCEDGWRHWRAFDERGCE